MAREGEGMSGTGMRRKRSSHRERIEGKNEKKQHLFGEGKGLRSCLH